MVLSSLGVRNIAVENNWVSFDETRLRDSNNYGVVVRFSGQNLSLAYSFFRLRYLTNYENQVVAFPESDRIFIDTIDSLVPIFLPSILQRNARITLQIRRFSFWDSPSFLSDVNVELLIDTGDRF